MEQQDDALAKLAREEAVRKAASEFIDENRPELMERAKRYFEEIYTRLLAEKTAAGNPQ